MEATTQVVSAYLSRNPVETSELSELIREVSASLLRVSEAGARQAFMTRNGALDAKGRPIHYIEAETLGQKPAVPVENSVTPDYIICLEDGKQLKMLKRHLRAVYDMTPEDYRRKWGLPEDYPMVAPNYAKVRSKLAKQGGFGTNIQPNKEVNG